MEATSELHDVEFYSKKLKSPRREPLLACSLADYINAIVAISESWYRDVLFRGQANADWKITSNAYRVIEKQAQPNSKLLQKYHEQLLHEAGNINDKAITEFHTLGRLAYLQHINAKTGLIDYSTNPLVTLWFACWGESERNGAVYFMRRDNKLKHFAGTETIDKIYSDEKEIYLFEPPNLLQRITSQHGLFLFHASGVIEKDAHNTILIDKSCKTEILEQLALFGVSRKHLFRDLHGLSEWFVFEDEADKEPPRVQIERLSQLARTAATNGKMDELDRLLDEIAQLKAKMQKGGV